MKITACKVNHLSDPCGFELSSPRISWNVEESNGSGPVWSRVVVATDKEFNNVVFDTGEADCDCLGTPVNVELEPLTKYYYTVSVKSDAGEEAVSDVHCFETAGEGALAGAKWIGCEDNSLASPVFSKQIESGDGISEARLYITGLGLYEAFIDGVRVSDEYLTPYCNDYSTWIQYQTYDVTGLLRNGSKLQVALGSGWYKGRFGFRDPEGTGFYGHKYLLLAKLIFKYADGTCVSIVTDETWKVKKSSIIFSNIYDGEQRDDTLFEGGAGNALPFPASAAENALPFPAGAEQPVVLIPKEECPKAELTARYSLPVRIIEELPVKKIVTPAGETVFDAGQNITGLFRMRVRAKRGQRIHLQFGEVLQDGNFYRENLRSAKAEYIYISDGTEKTITPHFTFYGYRYIRVSGYEDISESDITALALSTQLEETGRITCGHPLVERLISNVRWGCRDNFVDVPTDCPQRDERMGWTGDAQVFAPTASYLNDSYGFYRKYLHDMCLEQTHHNGGVPYTIPAFGMDPGSSVWGDAATLIPWTVYRFSGDVTILREQYASMRAWVDWITAVDGADCGWRTAFHYGDWLALDIPNATPDQRSGATDKGFIADVYYMHSAEIVSKTAEILGKQEDAEKYGALSGNIRERILAEFYSPNGRCCCDTQTGLVLTLMHGLADRERTAKRLRRKIEDNGCKLDCGFVGAPLLCVTLSENGMSDVAAKLLLNEEYPGWLYEVKLGATTVWERWNSLEPDGHISSTGMNSLNHYAYGSILEWIYAYVAGLRPLKPGFGKARIAPCPIKELGFVEAEYRSAAGLWKVSWKYDAAGKPVYKLTVPFGAEAEVELPGMEKKTLKAGTYEF